MIKIKGFLLPFALLLVLATATLCFSGTDPELKECKHQCNVQQRLDEGQIRACLQQCQSYHQESRQKERQEGGGNLWDWDMSTVNSHDPEKRYEKCIKECRRGQAGWPRQQQCQRQCEKEFPERERERGRGDSGSINKDHEGREQQQEQEAGQQQKQEENPYVFEEQHFTTKIQTQHGRVRALPKFTERSKLLKGIENYRLTILEAEPNTFVVPNHWDAEAVFFVATGKGTVGLVHEDKRERFSIRRGDIIRVPIGTTTYLVNSDSNNKLVIAKLLQPVFIPGHFESFFGAGGENPESYYHAFSNEILEAAFNTRKDGLQRVFGQQKQGVIIKATEEQIKALSHHEAAQIWPFRIRGESRAIFNIFEKGPSQSNQYGQLYEVDSDEYRPLQDLDVAISLANISKGGMTAPVYSSRATKISVVLNGEGYMEMACPHLSSQSQGRQGSQEARGGSGSQSQGLQGSQEEWGGSGRGSQPGERRGGPSYQKVSARLRRGTVIIVPAGHPFVAVASNNRNLEIVCFEINANRNKKYPLAGKSNIFKQLEREAKELTFGVSAREIEELFNSQHDEYFFKGPRQQRQQQYEGRADA